LAEVMSRNAKSLVGSRPWLYPILKSINNFRCRMWDVMHAVDTCGEVPLASLDFQSPNKGNGLQYASHHPLVTRPALAALDIDHRNYTFIDFGCGKGRVLLLASEFPYRRIVGLEFAPQLARTAQQNLQTYRTKTMKCHDISVICTDVADYRLPSEPEVLYFYNPFAPEVMQRVAQEITQSLQRSPRDVRLVLTGPLPSRDRTFHAFPHFERLRRERYFDLYRYSGTR
jgi:SAM-dependent methyltransferase